MTINGTVAEAGQGWDDLVALWQTMEWPEGSKVEIVEGVITVAPLVSVHHTYIAGHLNRWLHGATPEAHLKGGGFHLSAELARLAVEITTPHNAHHDRVMKRHAYAAAGIPPTSSSTAGPRTAPPSRCTASRRVTPIAPWKP
ncbi:hypothetical protein ABZ930_13425 [Streptomyces sp. NPDC046716]|uniref:hypothetical protein n=1 Tax=Streptomyces sp. NPDC046716 TaxID=3157093 RepID=UPI0033E68369